MSERALYVYGVVPAATDAATFAGARGVYPSEPIVLVRDRNVAAVTSSVPLDEFGEQAIEANLADAAWVADKARAHDRVLAAAVGRTAVVPFRFGAIYRTEQHVLDLLREREDLGHALARLEGTVELGVKAYVDLGALRDALMAREGAGVDAEPSGRAYMQRKQLERRIDDKADRAAGELAARIHERLSTHARAGRANPLRPGHDEERRLVLNGAYLVEVAGERAFRAAAAELAEKEGAAVALEVTGPWPPYNFVEEDEPA